MVEPQTAIRIPSPSTSPSTSSPIPQESIDQFIYFLQTCGMPASAAMAKRMSDRLAELEARGV